MKDKIAVEAKQLDPADKVAYQQVFSPDSTFDLLSRKKLEIDALNRELAHLRKESKEMQQKLLRAQLERDAYADQQYKMVYTLATTKNQLQLQAEISKRFSADNSELRYQIKALMQNKRNTQDENRILQLSVQNRKLEARVHLLESKLYRCNDEKTYQVAKNPGQQTCDLEKIRAQFSNFKELCYRTLYAYNYRIEEFEKMLGKCAPVYKAESTCKELDVALEQMQVLVAAAAKAK